ncbi:MAG: tyrosine-type recombinase/integrase [Dehalococcoidia bacterium]
MSKAFESRLGPDLSEFLKFKRALGFSYRRAEYTLRSFDRFVAAHAPQRGRLPLERLLRSWLAHRKDRKPVTVAMDLGPVREFFRFRRRSHPDGFVPGREWAPQAAESHFVPHVFSPDEVRTMLTAADALPGPPLRAMTFRVLICILYCTGLRLGEAVRLRVEDVDLQQLTFVVRESKGKTRLVPFRADLGRVLQRYRQARPNAVDTRDTFLLRPDGKSWTTRGVSSPLRRLLRRTGLKPAKGRNGPRPFDFRHTFAVHRLTRWYRAGVDLHARLPWLSAYMGHDDLLGTEDYLKATPELLAVASHRFAARVH